MVQGPIHPTHRLFSDIRLAAGIQGWMTPDVKKLSIEEKSYGLMLNYTLGIEWGKERDREEGREGQGTGEEERQEYYGGQWLGWEGRIQDRHYVWVDGAWKSISRAPLAQNWATCPGISKTRLATLRLLFGIPRHKGVTVCHFLFFPSSDFNYKVWLQICWILTK